MASRKKAATGEGAAPAAPVVEGTKAAAKSAPAGKCGGPSAGCDFDRVVRYDKDTAATIRQKGLRFCAEHEPIVRERLAKVGK